MTYNFISYIVTCICAFFVRAEFGHKTDKEKRHHLEPLNSEDSSVSDFFIAILNASVQYSKLTFCTSLLMQFLSCMRMCEQGLCDWDWCTYICLWTKTVLNRTLAIDSPFQTFVVGLLLEFLE